MCDELLGELDARFVSLMRKRMVKWEFLHLPQRRLTQPLLAKAERGAGCAAGSLNVLIASIVKDINALTTCNNMGPFGFVHAQIGEGMQIIGCIDRRQGFWLGIHGVTFELSGLIPCQNSLIPKPLDFLCVSIAAGWLGRR